MAAAAQHKPPIDVVVRHMADLEEVIVNVAETASIRELKEILSVQVERPELVEVGELLRILPDGSSAPIKDTMKVGVRRLFGFQGCPLYPKPPDRPPLSLEDFGEFDPDEEVMSSPRSVRACLLEGVAPEDLLYVPIEAYRSKRIEPRIADLWYDFFEALRQDTLRATREVRQMLITEEEGKFHSADGPVGRFDPYDSRVAGTGGNWCGALEHSRYSGVQEFFEQRSEMCNIDRIYKGATKPFRPVLPGSRYFSNAKYRGDEDPVLAGDTADDAADKLDDLLHFFKRLPNSKKFVKEQRINTEATGIVQYGENVKQLHKDQSEERRLLGHRIEAGEMQISLADGRIMDNNEARKMMNQNWNDSKPPASKLEIIRSDAINKRAAHFAERREFVHETQLDNEYNRLDEMQRLTLHDQACQERVHQHRSKTMLHFARQWAMRRTQWQLNNNSLSANRNAWNQATLDKQQAATDRVDCQRLIRQKWIEYRRELKALKRLYADLALKRENGRQDARREAVANEFQRRAFAESHPSPSPVRRSQMLTGSLSSTALGSMQSMGSMGDLAATAPFSHLLKQPRVVKRIARFDFPRMGSGFMSTATSSTRSGNWSTSAPSTMRSTSMPNLGGTSQSTAQELQRALTYA